MPFRLSRYDTFVSDIQSDHEEEGTKQKNFEALVKTKKDELKSLQTTLTNKKEKLGEKGELV
jgi:hypothetical protein